MTTESPEGTVALSEDGKEAIVVHGAAFVLYVYNPATRSWDVEDFWGRKAAEMMRKLPTDPEYALKWANKSSGVPYA